MADEKAMPETLDTIAGKISALSQSVDSRFAQVDARFADVDKRFDEVSEAFVEQRQYTEFAFTQLRTEMKAGFDGLGQKARFVS